jgi:hypothetical protein
MHTFKSFFGKCSEDTEAQEIAEKVYALFKIPICKLHIQKAEGRAYLSGLQPMEKNEFSPNDLRRISKEVSLIPMQGEFISG